MSAVAVVVALLAAPQAAPAPTPTPVAPADRIVCRYIAPPGSRLAQRVCKTSAQWKAGEIDPDTRRHLDEAIARRGTNG